MGDSKKETREQRLRYAFGTHSKVQELHVTSDDQMFTNQGDAKVHAATLEDRTVNTEKRSDHIKVASPAEKIAEKVWTERELLFKKHEELFGAPPAKSASTAKVKEKIEIEEKRLEEVSKKDQPIEGSAVTDNGSEEEDPNAGKGDGPDTDGQSNPADPNAQDKKDK